MDSFCREIIKKTCRMPAGTFSIQLGRAGSQVQMTRAEFENWLRNKCILSEMQMAAVMPAILSKPRCKS